MSVVTSGTISSSLGGTVLTFLDTSTGVGTLISRVLTIYDANSTLLSTTNMGATLSATYDISSDQYLTFVETIVDNTGTYVLTLSYLAEGIYVASFLSSISALRCSCNSSKFCNLFKAELNLVAAERFALSALGVSADQCLTNANVYVNA